MSNRSSSRTEQRQTTNTSSTQLGLEDIDGPVLIGDGSLTISTLDGGAIEESFDLANNVIEGSFDVIEDITDTAFEFGEDALEASLAGVDRSFEFAEESLMLIDEATALAVRSADESRDAALSFAAGTIQNSQQLIDDSQERAFTFAGGAFSAAIEGIEDASDNALDTVAELARQTNESLADSQQDAIDAVANATQSDAAKSIDKITIIAGLAVLSFAAVTVFRG